MIDKNTKLVDLTRLTEYKALSDKLYAKKADVETEVEHIIINGHEAIDLGIVLSNGNHLLWAACNVGATTPEESGLYFQWGDTQGYADSSSKAFNWANYKWNPSGDGTTFTKYNTTDNKTVLDLEDDAAHVNMGGNWKIPTTEQQKELYDNTTWTWTTINGVNGYNVVSKTNGNSLFFPAAGYCINFSIYGVGSYGYYWSSSRCRKPISAFNILFYSFYINTDYVDNRYHGFSVRGVIELTDEELNNIKNPRKFYTKEETYSKSEIETMMKSLSSDIKEDEYSEDEILNVINPTT